MAEIEKLLPTTTVPDAPPRRCPLGMSKAARVILGLSLAVTAVTMFMPGCLSKNKSPSDVCPFEQPDISTPIYKSTRPHLFRILNKALPEPLTILLPVAPRILQAESDGEYPNWKQTANVKYILDQFTIDGGVVGLTRKANANAETQDGELYDISVYLPIQTDRDVVFTGAYPSKEALIEQFHVQEVYSVADLPAHLALKVKSGESVVSTVSQDILVQSLPASVISELEGKNIKIPFSFEAQQAFWNARFIKTDEELVRLTYASRLAAWVHKKVGKYISKADSITEIELHAEFTRLSALCGGDLQSYPPIVGAGPDAAVLHYRTGTFRGLAHTPVPDETFILIDAAPEFVGYTSDLTRTYPRHKKWNAQMKEVYGIVERVQSKFVHTHYQLDADWAAINLLSKIDLTEELIKAGFILGTVEEAVAANVANTVFMPHGLGHPVGLEVHDPTPASFIGSRFEAAFIPNEELGSFFAWSKETHPRLYDAALANFKVPKGHVCTVEPGVYFIPKLLEQVKKSPIAKFVNWTKIEEGDYVSLGGVRIEDVVLFDHAGNKRIITRE